MGDRYIGLVRVSTDRQADSGLGLTAGRDDLERHCASVGGVLIDVLQEVESGTHDRLIRRPVLRRAIALCKRHRAILLVPKVDRLVRSTNVHAEIKRSGIAFRAVDNPHANEFTLDILVAVAAQEGRAISDRTTKALKAYKDHGRISHVQMLKLLMVHGKEIPAAEIEAARDKAGVARLVERHGHLIPPAAIEAVRGKLGSHLAGGELTPAARAAGRATAGANRTRAAVEAYEDLVAEMQALRAGGKNLREIAEELNRRGERSRTDAPWCKVKVKRVLDRAGKPPSR